MLALAIAVNRIRDSCSGHACFRHCLLSMGPPRPGNTKTRLDERSTRDFAFYLAFGRAGLCCGRNLIELLRPRWFPALVAFHRPAAPGKRKNARRWAIKNARRWAIKNARRWAIYARFCVLLGLWPCWALSWPESGIALPATTGFRPGLPRQGNAKERVDDRSTPAAFDFWSRARRAEQSAL